MNKTTYLGDGLHVRDACMQFELSTERENGENIVYLDNSVLDAFFRFIEKSRGVKITVTQMEDA